jgi:anti-sigma factor RsiW
MEPREDHELSALIKARATRHRAPEALQQRVGAALQAARGASTRRSSGRWQGWLRLAAAFACGVIVSVVVVQLRSGSDEAGRLAGELIDSHVRSLMGDHLADVASSDQHTVKPWFAGKLDFSPPVADLAAAGFPLVGGRLDYLGGRTVAALVYRHDRHTINVFVWPVEAARTELPAGSVRQGFNLIAWRSAAMEFCAVSDLNPGELGTFVGLLRQANG